MGINENVLGTLLVGIFFNTYLYGLVTYQFAAYHNTKFDDPIWIRSFVGALFVVDTFHTAATIYMAWEYCVTNFDNSAIMAVALWPYTFTPIGTAIAALVTQIFLGYRIYRLTDQLWMYIGVLICAIASFGLGCACGIRAWIIRELTKLVVLDKLVTAWLAMQTGIDIFITVVLVYVLSRARTRFRATDTVINRLIRGAIQTGVFASIFSMGDLIAFLAVPHINLYGMFAIPIGRIYTNTLMDTLLMREGLRDILSQSTNDTMNASSSIWGRSIASKDNMSRISFNKANIRSEARTDMEAPRDSENGDSKWHGPTEQDHDCIPDIKAPASAV